MHVFQRMEKNESLRTPQFDGGGGGPCIFGYIGPDEGNGGC